MNEVGRVGKAIDGIIDGAVENASLGINHLNKQIQHLVFFLYCSARFLQYNVGVYSK